MRIATFGVDEALEQALEATGSAERVGCLPASPAEAELPAALEAAESALDRAAAEAAVIAGDGDWALAAALACAKAVVPYAFVSPGGDSNAGHAGHVARLAATVVSPSEGPPALQRWLATLGD